MKVAVRVTHFLLVSGCLAALLPSAVRAQDANASSDTPYATIVARNMFGLLPIPKVDPKDSQPLPEPPPKITPNGIMTIFGKDQALFKVAVKPKPGQPAKDESYVLAEGERQDDIEVVKINHTDEIITFNNHGTIQELPLVVAKETGGPPPGVAPGRAPFGMPSPMPIPGRAMPGMNPFQRTMPAGSPGAGYNNSANSPNNAFGAAGSSAGANGISLVGGTPVNANGIYQPTADPEGMTPEQNALLIEAQRMKNMQAGQTSPDVLPPTPLTEQNIRENRRQQ